MRAKKTFNIGWGGLMTAFRIEPGGCCFIFGEPRARGQGTASQKMRAAAWKVCVPLVHLSVRRASAFSLSNQSSASLRSYTSSSNKHSSRNQRGLATNMSGGIKNVVVIVAMEGGGTTAVEDGRRCQLIFYTEGVHAGMDRAVFLHRMPS